LGTIPEIRLISLLFSEKAMSHHPAVPFRLTPFFSPHIWGQKDWSRWYDGKVFSEPVGTLVAIEGQAMLVCGEESLPLECGKATVISARTLAVTLVSMQDCVVTHAFSER
jgi:hypothetical protein